MRLSGKAGAQITIDTSSDLRNWIFLLKTNSPAADFEVMDAAATLNGSRFYRATYGR